MTRARTRHAWSLLAICSLIVAAACGGDDDTATAPSAGSTAPAASTGETAGGSDGTGAATTKPAADEGAPVNGGRIVLAVADEPTLGLEPWTAITDDGGSAIATAIYDTLAAFDADGKPVPLLAESIEANADATVWTVKLRSGIKFTDGTDLKADAIVNQFESARAAGRELQEGFKVEQVDDLTARFTFLQPFVAFPASMATQWSWMPSPTASKQLGEGFREHPVGTGPYKLKEWVRDDHITLVRNEDYWRKDVPHLDEVEFRIITDDAARKAALQAGDVDGIMVGQADIATMRSDSKFNVNETKAGVGGICFNTTKAPLDDLRVRQALSMAIDVKAVIDTVFDGVGTPATGPLPSTNPFYHAPTSYPTYDPEKAQQLIADYESSGGTPISLEYLYENTPLAQQLAELLQAYWQAIGVDVTLASPLNVGDTQTRRVEHQFDIVSCGMAAVFDPDAWLTLFRSDSFLNYSGLVDAELDKAVDDTRSSLDPEAREEAYARVQQRLADQLPWFFISEAVLATATTPRVHGMDSWTLPDGSPGTSKQFWLPFTAEALWVDPAGG